MARDAALLADPWPATVRIYRWSPAGLSLGRFQREEEFAAVPGSHRVVRRITGGGAIYHADEITFALAYDAERLPVALDESYRLVHEAIRAALAGFGARTRRVEQGATCSGRPREAWCFASPGRHDLVTPDGRKIVGSAQRRVRAPRARVLHHGSIVLRAPAATPFCGSLAELLEILPPLDALESAIAAHIARLFE